MMREDAVLQRVQAIVIRIAGHARRPVDPTPDTPLGEHGYWLDSVDLLELIVACEEEFGTTFDADRELDEGSLTTVRTLADAIRSRTG
jgi:acyl carrier protein